MDSSRSIHQLGRRLPRFQPGSRRLYDYGREGRIQHQGTNVGATGAERGGTGGRDSHGWVGHRASRRAGRIRARGNGARPRFRPHRRYAAQGTPSERPQHFEPDCHPARNRGPRAVGRPVHQRRQRFIFRRNTALRVRERPALRRKQLHAGRHQHERRGS